MNKNFSQRQKAQHQSKARCWTSPVPKRNFWCGGFSIIEILAVIAVIAIALSSLLGMAVLSLKVSTLMKETNQANALAQETMEAVRNFRDGTAWNSNGLGAMTIGVDYYSRVAGSPASWEFIPGAETIGQFSRKIIFSNVLRDANKNIVPAGGANDPDTKKAAVTVSWKDKKVKIEAYFTNWKQ